MIRSVVFSIAILMFNASCSSSGNHTRPEATRSDVRLITLDPGHFHAALIQKTMYPGVDSVVHVYAPEGNDVALHLDRIRQYNTREESPTSWNEIVYKGPDFLSRMLAEKKGNVVVLAGNNKDKSTYIAQCVGDTLHVLSDKPMAITPESFNRLLESFAVARKNDVLLYDIMTERYEITTILQKELSRLPDVFGQLEQGSLKNPAVTKESVHYFHKNVSGKVLTRPAWFFDITQEGAGIVDVTTHLVDLVQWECFPEQVLDYERDIELLEAKQWPTELSRHQFRAITKIDEFPEYLRKYTRDSLLMVNANGEINYKLKGVHAKVSVTWGYKAEEGAGDTHFSIMRGTKCNLVIRQGRDEAFKPMLYIEPVKGTTLSDSVINAASSILDSKYPGVSIVRKRDTWEVSIPDKYREGHEAHFARVAEKFLDYLKNSNMPEWEVPNMLAKYYTTTKAFEMANVK